MKACSVCGSVKTERREGVDVCLNPRCGATGKFKHLHAQVGDPQMGRGTFHLVSKGGYRGAPARTDKQ